MQTKCNLFRYKHNSIETHFQPYPFILKVFGVEMEKSPTPAPIDNGKSPTCFNGNKIRP